MIYVLLTYLLAPWWWLAKRLQRRGKVERILLVQTAKIGDMLCATPVILALRQHYPDAQLTVLHAPVTGKIISGMSEVDHCIAIRSDSWRGWGGKWRLARLIAAGRYDLAVNLSPSLPLLCGLIWAGVPRTLSIMPTKVGRTLAALRRCIDLTEQHRPGELVLATKQRLLQQQGIAMGLRKKMAIAASGETVCDRLGIAGDHSAIGLAISSANKLKELGEDLLSALVARLLRDYQGQVVLIGGLEDGSCAAAVQTRVQGGERVINAAGAFQLDELPALMQRLQLFIGVDSGLTYLADTFDVPMVVIVGPVDFREQRPLGARVQFVSKQPPCYPCAFVFNAPYACKTGDRACIRTVAVGDILVAAKEALND
ncbi:glycosyltransferase family 9 protein [Vogesella indigofera]|uniref:glycosyltransferase family 9 protein n=1 Tax=Vogesella indigofera TaxID=45465 RepID=UPI00234FB289|nr:glycosyltransferase family 9 protein [Vogesella indigofera]MDC7702204.1 glycosyltransferase family 9 protein [Vogesella indigofera]